MQAAKEQAIAAQKLPELREAEAAAAAALQRLTIAKAQTRGGGHPPWRPPPELEKRLAQLDADIARENQIMADNAEVLARLDEEERSLNAEQTGNVDKEAEANAAVERAEAELSRSETELAAVTARRAEASAQRSQFERSLNDAAERRQRAEARIVASDAELADIADKLAALADPAEMQRGVDAALQSIEAAEARAQAAEKAVAEARHGETTFRPAVQEARSELGRIETEARTLAKVLSPGTGELFPAVLEQLSVERGFETALGAALGEDLDVPLDRSAPVHWSQIPPSPDDPLLPEGVRPLANFVRAPGELARRLRQIGIVDEGQGELLQPLLKVGQCLVSPAGALWRWDGYRASADAPTAAAQRLAQKNRLAELEAEADGARARVADAEALLARAEAASRQGAEADRAAREEVRRAQASLGEAREALARAERAAGELVNRRTALEEARAGLAETRDEAAAAVQSAREGLATARRSGRAAGRTGPCDGRRRGRSLPRLPMPAPRMTGFAREAPRGAAAGRDRRRPRPVDGAGRQRRQPYPVAAIRVARRRRLKPLRSKTPQARSRPGAGRLMTQLSDAEAIARHGSRPAGQQAEDRQKHCDRPPATRLQALSSRARGPGPRRRARDRRGRTAQGGRGAHPRGAQRAAASGRPACRTGPDKPLPDMGEIERRLERLKIERERLGAVNLRAEEEQKELSERLETIVTEREDIIEAIRKLRQAIQSLNREGRERLLAAFEVVNGHFQRLFTTHLSAAARPSCS
jgi:chromosome segregation protein